jgi:catechol 2,3-dioxygenase-like lactoylglutathione lyase family enzyme
MSFTNVVPNLLVSDMAKSIAFYRDVLGCSMVAHVPDESPFVFAWMQRGKADFFLNDAGEVQRDLAGVHGARTTIGGAAMYVTVEGIDEIHRAIAARIPVAAPLEKKFYGMTEFAVVDPDGYLITLAERRD